MFIDRSWDKSSGGKQVFPAIFMSGHVLNDI